MNEKQSVLKSIDWITIAIYLALLAFGWVSVCGASYSLDQPDIVSLNTRSGMQLVWIGTSLILGTVLLLLDGKIFETFAFAIYAIMLLVLFLTIFNPHEIKGSRSWIVMGPLRLQPAEFAKFATALAVAKMMSAYKFVLSNWGDLLKAVAIIITPKPTIITYRSLFNLVLKNSSKLVIIISPKPMYSCKKTRRGVTSYGKNKNTQRNKQSKMDCHHRTLHGI